MSVKTISVTTHEEAKYEKKNLNRSRLTEANAGIKYHV